MDSHRVDKGKRPATSDAAADEPSQMKKRQKSQQVALEETHQQLQSSALLRLPQELQDIIYGYVYGGRKLTLDYGNMKGFVLKDDQAWYDNTRECNVALPGLSETCRQLRTTSKLYFEFNEIDCIWKNRESRYAIVLDPLTCFTEALSENQRDSVKYICFSCVLNITECFEIMTAYWNAHYHYGNEYEPSGQFRQHRVFPLARMSSLKQVLIYVRDEQKGAEMFIPAVRAVLGLSSGVTIEIRSQKHRE